jgi:hypothetical protein
VTAMMNPDPEPDLGSEVEEWLADQEPEPVDDNATPELEVWPETKRVRDLRAEVAEAHKLLALQADQAALLVDTPRVRRRRKQGAEAAHLHALANQPALLAWQAARWRRALTVVAFVALTLALGWSTAGVQVFAAEGAQAWQPRWVFAWLVEPFLSLALLTVVAARAYLGTRGQPVESPTLRRIEWLFLGLTLGMNAWPHLPGVTDRFTVSGLVLHILGPIVAVAIATALPIIWRAFADLDHGLPYSPTYPTSTSAEYRANTPLSPSATEGATQALVARALGMIKDGQLPPKPSATLLRKALGCGTDNAQKVRDALRGEA